MTIYYDNHCPNCTRFSKIVRKLDWFKLITIKQLRNTKHIQYAQGIDIALAEQQMASFHHKWRYGYTTLFNIFLRLPLFWIFIPILYLLEITKIGQYLYIKIAVNRKIIPLHCSKDSCQLK